MWPSVAVMLLLAGFDWKLLVVVFLVVGGLVLLMALRDPYSLKRIEVMHNPEKDPLHDGYQLLQLIRESGIEGADRIPVVALSANVGKEQEHYQEAGFTAFLNKPFTAAQLISLLNNLLKLRLKPGAGFDFSSLTAFAGEDGEASMGILRTFVEETRKSIAGLTEARAVADRVEAGRIAHKLIPLFAMLGANTLVQHLRLLEKQDPDLSSSTWLQLLDEVLAQAQLLVEEAESYTVKDYIS